MPTIDQPKKNHLLAALPEAEWSRWLPQLEPVSLPLGKVLYGVASENGKNRTVSRSARQQALVWRWLCPSWAYPNLTSGYEA